jgi:hypothetical protein
LLTEFGGLQLEETGLPLHRLKLNLVLVTLILLLLSFLFKVLVRLCERFGKSFVFLGKAPILDEELCATLFNVFSAH